MNQAIEEWSTRVKIDMVYVLPDGWNSTTYAYTLPPYIRPPLRPQVRFDTQPNYGGGNTWTDLRSFNLETNTDGDLVLRIRLFPYDPNLTHEGRIVWYAVNSPLPVNAPALSSGISASDTSLTVNASVDVADTGWVKVDSEWLCYAGVTRGASTTVLLNLQRGVDDTTAATHNSAAIVEWGIAAPTQALYKQLLHQTLSGLHHMFLTDASPQERDLHERMMLYHDNKASEGWRRFTPRAPRMVTELERL